MVRLGTGMPRFYPRYSFTNYMILLKSACFNFPPFNLRIHHLSHNVIRWLHKSGHVKLLYSAAHYILCCSFMLTMNTTKLMPEKHLLNGWIYFNPHTSHVKQALLFLVQGSSHFQKKPS